MKHPVQPINTLSEIKQHEELKACAQSHPAAFSGKRVRIVTRPDVKRALFLWVKHLEEKGETVSGPMLQVKRGKFEKALNVPESEQLKARGGLVHFAKREWHFCNHLNVKDLPKFSHQIKEYRRHGEAGSVDVSAV